MIAALFDADGTLYSAQFGRGLMKYAQTHGRRVLTAFYFASLAPTMLWSRLTHAEVFDRLKILRLPWLIRGWNEAQALQAFGWVTDEYLLTTRRADAIERLQSHQSRGHWVVIVSGTFTPSLELLGRRFGVSDLVGTGIEMIDGRYTGRIIPPLIKGADKVAQIRKYIADRNLQIDWRASYAYGDSYTDRDMLELVGHPVAVYPDAKLRALAQARGWELLQQS